MSTDYNGWTNWETWHTALLADNDELLYNSARAMARACLKFEGREFDWARAEQGFKRCLHSAWMQTKRFAAENQKQYGNGWAIEGKVNWREVAAHFMDAEREEIAQ
jgi:hypothetical protein